MSAAARATAFAPASVANLAVGFDLLGHPFAAAGDRVSVRRVVSPGVVMAPATGSAGPLPRDPAANTAGAALLGLLRDHAPGMGVEVSIHKGIPLGSGIGGSAASAVAAVVACNQLLAEPLGLAALFPYALAGEAVASGAVHGDNVAPSLFGGLVLVRSAEPADVVPLPVPRGLRCVVVLPELRVDTRAARAVLPDRIRLADHVRQAGNLAGVIAGLASGDLRLVARSLEDVLVEPWRAPLVPGFAAVKAGAAAAGALGCSISGGGPAVFAWCDGERSAGEARERMVAAFAAEGVRAAGWTCPVDGPGARVEEVAG